MEKQKIPEMVLYMQITKIRQVARAQKTNYTRLLCIPQYDHHHHNLVSPILISIKNPLSNHTAYEEYTLSLFSRGATRYPVKM